MKKAMVMFIGMEYFMKPYPLEAMLARKESLQFKIQPISTERAMLIVTTSQPISGTTKQKTVAVRKEVGIDDVVIKFVGHL